MVLGWLNFNGFGIVRLIYMGILGLLIGNKLLSNYRRRGKTKIERNNKQRKKE